MDLSERYHPWQRPQEEKVHEPASVPQQVYGLLGRTFELLSVGAGGILGHASAFWRLDRKDYAL